MDAFACAAFLAYWAHHARAAATCGAGSSLGALLGARDAGPRAGARARRGRRARARAVGDAGADARGRARCAGSAAARSRSAVALVVFVAAAARVARSCSAASTELPQGARYTRLEVADDRSSCCSRRATAGSRPRRSRTRRARPRRACRARARASPPGSSPRSRVQVYLNSTIFDWWGGAAFGQRRLCSVTLPLVVGLAALLWRGGPARARARAGPRAAWHVRVGAPRRSGRSSAWNLARVSTCAGQAGPVGARAVVLRRRAGPAARAGALALRSDRQSVRAPRERRVRARRTACRSRAGIQPSGVPARAAVDRAGRRPAAAPPRRVADRWPRGMAPYLVAGFSARGRAPSGRCGGRRRRRPRCWSRT